MKILAVITVVLGIQFFIMSNLIAPCHCVPWDAFGIFMRVVFYADVLAILALVLMVLTR